MLGTRLGVSTLRRIGFARWRSDVPSGGNRYDDELVAGLRALGVDVREQVVAGAWPCPDDGARRQLSEVLTTEAEWLVDNILAAGAPEVIRAARAEGRGVTILVHYFPADEPGWTAAGRDRLRAAEAASVTAASGIIATSAWTAGQVETRYGRAGALISVPGVDPAPLAPGSGHEDAPRLLWLARLTRTKDPITLVGALGRLTDVDWTAYLVGPATPDPGLTQEVRERIEATGLASRVEMTGARTDDELEAIWAATDLLVHTARVEPYGMVVTEALARGIPSVVPAGTGATEAQRVGGTFPPGDVEALAAMLRRWLTDPDLRRRWHHAARRERGRLPTWRATAETVMGVLSR